MDTVKIRAAVANRASQLVTTGQSLPTQAPLHAAADVLTKVVKEAGSDPTVHPAVSGTGGSAVTG
jgi:hypothetical protein